MDLLFVEDEAAVANLYLPYFEKSGWRTHWVTTVGAGIAAVLQRPYDAVLLDLLLKEEGHPDGDGLDVLRAMRSHGLQTPVVICSSYGTERRAIGLGEEFGVVTVLAKPVDTRTLLMCLAAAAAAAAAAGKTSHEPIAVAREELAILDFTHTKVRDQIVGVLLRPTRDRWLPLASFARLCEGVLELAASVETPSSSRMADVLEGAEASRSVGGSDLVRVLAILADVRVSNEAELARLSESSVKAVRHCLIHRTGHGFNWWRRMSRVRRFVIRLLTTTDRTTQCAYWAGYPQARHAWRDCRSVLGLGPDEVRTLVRVEDRAK